MPSDDEEKFEAGSAKPTKEEGGGSPVNVERTLSDISAMLKTLVVQVKQQAAVSERHEEALFPKEAKGGGKAPLRKNTTLSSTSDSSSDSGANHTPKRDKLRSNRSRKKKEPPRRVTRSEGDHPLTSGGKSARQRPQNHTSAKSSSISIRFVDKPQSQTQALRRAKGIDDIMSKAPVFDPNHDLTSVFAYANNLGEWMDNMHSQGVLVRWFDALCVFVDHMNVQKVSGKHTLSQATTDDLKENRRFLVGNQSSVWDYQASASMDNHPAGRHLHKFCEPGAIRAIITALGGSMGHSDATHFSDSDWRCVFGDTVKLLMQKIVSSSSLDDAAVRFSINNDESCAAFVLRVSAHFEELQANSDRLDHGSRMTVQVQTVIAKAHKVVMASLTKSHARGLVNASNTRWLQSTVANKRDWAFLVEEARRIDGLVMDARFQATTIQDSINSLAQSSGVHRDTLIASLSATKPRDPKRDAKTDPRKQPDRDNDPSGQCTLHPNGTHTNQDCNVQQKGVRDPSARATNIGNFARPPADVRTDRDPRFAPHDGHACCERIDKCMRLATCYWRQPHLMPAEFRERAVANGGIKLQFLVHNEGLSSQGKPTISLRDFRALEPGNDAQLAPHARKLGGVPEGDEDEDEESFFSLGLFVEDDQRDDPPIIRAIPVRNGKSPEGFLLHPVGDLPGGALPQAPRAVHTAAVAPVMLDGSSQTDLPCLGCVASSAFAPRGPACGPSDHPDTPIVSAVGCNLPLTSVPLSAAHLQAAAREERWLSTRTDSAVEADECGNMLSSPDVGHAYQVAVEVGGHAHPVHVVFDTACEKSVATLSTLQALGIPVFSTGASINQLSAPLPLTGFALDVVLLFGSDSKDPIRHTVSICVVSEVAGNEGILLGTDVLKNFDFALTARDEGSALADFQLTRRSTAGVEQATLRLQYMRRGESRAYPPISRVRLARASGHAPPRVCCVRLSRAAPAGRNL